MFVTIDGQNNVCLKSSQENAFGRRRRLTLGAGGAGQVHKQLQEIVCPIHRAASLVADVTVIVILRELRMGPRRFGELLVPGLNPRTLSDRLQRLTQEGVLERNRYAESPPRVEYRLTAKGLALLPILQTLQTFGESWLPLDSTSLDASACLDPERPSKKAEEAASQSDLASQNSPR